MQVLQAVDLGGVQITQRQASGLGTGQRGGVTDLVLQSGAAETSCYLLIQLAAVIRVFLPLATPDLFRLAVVASGALWTAAFVP